MRKFYTRLEVETDLKSVRTKKEVVSVCYVLRTTRVDVPLGQAVCAFLSRLPKAFPTVRARSVLLLEAEEKRGTVGARRRGRKVPDRYFSCQPPVSLQNMWYEKK